jgi:hypothetical protein
MNPERWHEIERLYHLARERQPQEREAILKEACAGDEALLKEVESLLNWRPKAEGFIESPPLEATAGILTKAQPDEPPGTHARLSRFLAAQVPFCPSRVRRHPPWWVLLIGAMFLFCAGTVYYDNFFGPDMGWILRPAEDSPNHDHYLVFYVVAGFGADRAGFQVGDLVARQDFLALAEDARTGARYEWEIRRGNQSKVLSFALRPRTLEIWLQREGIRCLLLLVVSSLYLMLAGIIVLTKPEEIVARWGALFLGQLGIVVIWAAYPLGSGTPEHWGVVRGLPLPLGAAVLTVLSCANMYPAGATTLLYSFPRRPFQRTWTGILLWVLALVVTLPLALRAQWLPTYAPAKADAIAGFWLLLIPVLGVCFLIAAALLLFRNYLRLRDINERRRLRFMAVGLGAGVFGGALFMIRTLSATGLLWQLSVYSTLLVILLLLPPVCTAYAILRHRMFDIRVMVRLGLQYAAARGLLLSLVPFLAVVLGIDLLRHRSQPLAEIMGGRGWIYASLGLVAFFLHQRQKPWLEALDRRFYRERYDAQRILRSVVEDVRAAPSFAEEASRVVSQIEAALHPEFAAILTREPGDHAYRVLAARPAAPTAIPADSRLMSLVRVLGKPVEIEQTDTGWLKRQLPPEESEFLTRARLEWIFPISLAGDQMEAFATLGPKRSEEPYSREDQDLLQAITASLALLLQRSAAPAKVSESYEECPECGTCYDSGTRLCVKEGAQLTPLPFARLLNARYRFERRLGRGGMGSVYQARDTELERHVAVKVIRSGMMAGAEAEARFRREAKAVAGFSHPNVVTVHDFGVSGDNRAYLVMELLSGGTLREELLRWGRLESKRVLEILSGVSAAAAAAHERNLVHRDLKPENIFLARSGQTEVAKILDFGLAKLMTPSGVMESIPGTAPGMLIGTLPYMSPEQMRGDPPAESWDLWALATVAFEMLTGVHPFGTSVDWRSVLIGGCIPPLAAEAPALTPQLREFFERSLAADRSRRPGTARQFIVQFEAALQKPDLSPVVTT